MPASSHPSRSPPGASKPLDPESCFLAHRATVYRWAAALGADHSTCHDIVQDAFLRLLRAAPVFETGAAQTGWLRRVTTNLVVDHRRARSRQVLGSAAEHRAAASGSKDPDAEAAARALDDLSEMQRLVMTCKLCDNLTFAQVADELGLAVPTVKTHYLRALSAIRDRLGVQVPKRRSGATT